MTAAEKRAEMEARLWRAKVPEHQVRAILAIADSYASSVPAETLDSVIREGRGRKRRQDLADALKEAS